MLPQPRPRNLPLERSLTHLAALGAGVPPTPGLDDFADARAHPGGVRANLDGDREAAEELADCRNYLCWAVEPIWDAHLKGDGQASADVERRLRALGGVVIGWRGLHTEAG